jgi:hypothetical protein
LGVNRELGVTDNVDEENVRDLKLDLFLKLGSHLGSHGDTRRDDTLKQAAESREESASATLLLIIQTKRKLHAGLICLGNKAGDEADSSVTAINVGELHTRASEPPLPLRSIVSHQRLAKTGQAPRLRAVAQLGRAPGSGT